MSEIRNFNEFYLNVGDGHRLYCWQAGNPNGVNFVYLHGGPGGSTRVFDTTFFDLDKVRVTFFDQRGCGKSTPRFSLIENNSDAQVEDIEKIRKFLKIDKWVVFGGSWGSCLALLYAQAHPESVSGLVLRGVFLGEKEDWHWLYQEGASWFYPQEFENFKNLAPENERKDLIYAYYKMLRSNDKEVVYQAARHYYDWEMLMLFLVPKILPEPSDEDVYQSSLIENHYAYHNTFLKQPNQILNNMDKIKHIKTYIIHGRYDLICRPIAAYQVYQRLENATLWYGLISGHSSREKELALLLRKATDEFCK